MNSLLTSMLFVPGGDERKLAKLDTLRAGALIIDLEDAVANARKAAARGLVADALRASTTSVPLWVRVNADDPTATVRDLDAIVGPRLAGIVLPKATTAADVHAVDWYLSALEGQRGQAAGAIRLMPTVESVAGVENAVAIAAAADRVECLIFGAGDFSLDAGLDWPAQGGVGPLLLSAKQKLVTASRLAGINPPHDGVFPMFRDLDGLRREAEQSRSLGMFGKHAIHPGQVATIDTVFAPSEQQIARAQRILAAFEASEAAGVGNIDVDGQFIDYPVANRARALLAMADAMADALTAGDPA